jgi:hypothetical protein
MQIHPIIFQFDLVFALSFKLGYNWVLDFCQKFSFVPLYIWKPSRSTLAKLLVFFLILKEKDNFRGNQKIV